MSATVISVGRASAQGTWTTKAPDPSISTLSNPVASGQINGLIYIYGYNDTGVDAGNSTLDIYNPTTNAWTTGATPLLARAGASVGVINGLMYVVGGCITSDCRIGITNQLEIYDPVANAWSFGASMVTARVGAAVGVIAGKLYVAGGLQACPPCNPATTTEIYDPVANSWTSGHAIPTSRLNMAGIAVNGLFYAIGGVIQASNVAVNNVDIYNPVLDSWSVGSLMPTPRNTAVAGVINGEIYVIGGVAAGGAALAVNERYDPAGDTWTEQAPMPTARYAAVGGVVGSNFYVIGGHNSTGAVAMNEAFTPPGALIPEGATFFGGPGDQRGTGIAINNGAIYLSGDVQPETQSSSDTALVLSYAVPTAAGSVPVWMRSFAFGTDFYGIAATGEGVYTDGWNYSLSTDNVGGKEVKSIMAKFPLDGSNGLGTGGSIWEDTPNFFSYSGVEVFQAATTSVESGSDFVYASGLGQPCSYSAYIVAKFDTSGNLIADATDSSVGIQFGTCSVPGGGGFSNAAGLTVVDGGIYAAGGSSWVSEGDSGGRPTIWKYNPSLNLVWRSKDTTLNGSFNAVIGLASEIYAVGSATGIAGSQDFLVEKYDESGNLIWRKTSGGSNTDVLTGITAVGDRVFAVGYTYSEGAGGADAVILEIDPATGNTLSTTLFGGSLDDKANGAATDGTDLYVVGESRSFASGAGNAVGQNDVMLLRYSLATTTTPTPTATPTPAATATATPTTTPTATATDTATATATATDTTTATATATDTATATATATDTATATPTSTATATATDTVTATATATDTATATATATATSTATATATDTATATATATATSTATATPTATATATATNTATATATATATNTATATATRTATATATRTATPTATATPQPGVFSLNEDEVLFLPRKVGTTSPPQTITVTDNSANQISSLSLSITGDFTKSTNCGSSLAGHASCNVFVTFHPTGTGFRSGTLTISGNASNSPKTVFLLGFGF